MTLLFLILFFGYFCSFHNEDLKIKFKENRKKSIFQKILQTYSKKCIKNKMVIVFKAFCYNFKKYLKKLCSLFKIYKLRFFVKCLNTLKFIRILL